VQRALCNLRTWRRRARPLHRRFLLLPAFSLHGLTHTTLAVLIHLPKPSTLPLIRIADSDEPQGIFLSISDCVAMWSAA
jgi:hypothetical protein